MSHALNHLSGYYLTWNAISGLVSIAANTFVFHIK